MNEWTELRIENIPPDIMVGDYEFAHYIEGSGWIEIDVDIEVHKILGYMCKSGSRYSYRPSRDERIGMFGKFWDDNDNAIAYGYLSGIRGDNPVKYACKDGGGHWQHF